MDEFHPLLIRQLKRIGIDLAKDEIPSQYEKLLQVISGTYKESDEGRYITERSLDITSQEMQELRQRLQKEKEVMQAVMSEGLCILSPAWKIISLNETAQKILGYVDGNETINLHYEDFTLFEGVDAPEKEINPEILINEFKKNRLFHCDRGYIINLKKKVIPISFSINPLPDLGNSAFGGAVLIIRDITESIQREFALKSALQFAEQSNKTKSLFLANMSHEIRTPMNGILGMLQILMHTPLNEKQINYTKKSYDSAQSLLQILGDILDFSKIEAGKVTIENVEFSIQQEIDALVAIMQSQAFKKQIILSLEMDDKIPKMVKGDPFRVKQIVTNLVSNAIKFTPENGVITIKIQKIGAKEDAFFIQISVTDTGIGIPKDRQAAIFDIFSQADESTTRKYGGTGLGLAIVKQLAELMGGQVTVNSTEGKGSTFTVTIKLSLVST